MYFRQLQGRLIEIARTRVQAGELTERGLARLCGVSQPHMHNVLKNLRALSIDSADRLMLALDIGVSDLLWQAPADCDARVRAIPVLRHRIGPGSDAQVAILQGHFPFPESMVGHMVEPLAARLGPDLVMPRALAAHDLILLDQNPQLRSMPGGDGLWVVAEDNRLRVRYVRLGGTRVYIADETTLPDPQKWHTISLQGRNILDVVRARIVWMGREMAKEMN